MADKTLTDGKCLVRLLHQCPVLHFPSVIFQSVIVHHRLCGRPLSSSFAFSSHPLNVHFFASTFPLTTAQRTRQLRNDILCVHCNVKPYSLTHSLTHTSVNTNTSHVTVVPRERIHGAKEAMSPKDAKVAFRSAAS